MKLGVCSNFRQADTVKKLGYDYIEEHFYRLSIYTEEEYLDAKKAYKDNISLKEACVALGFLTAERFDEVFHPEQMV